MDCRNCKAALPAEARFCTSCGAKVTTSFCENGHVLEAGEAFCRYCPQPQAASATRISISTTVEKPESPAAQRVTAVSGPERHTTAVPGGPSFAVTRIITDKEEDPVGLLGWLVVVNGGEPFRDFRIMKRKVTIGRARECDVVLNGDDVSAKHASLRYMPDGLYLTDLDSSNGTFVNDVEIARVKVSDNDMIRIGDTVLKFKAF